MPATLSQGNCQYTALGTGTTTLNPGQAAGLPAVASQPGVLYGAECVVLGTSPTLQVFDVIPPNLQGTNTATVTNVLIPLTTATLGQRIVAGLEGVGVRYRGALVAVVGGTGAPIFNGLWD